MKKTASGTRSNYPADYSDLVPYYERPYDFDRMSLMGVGRYRPLATELETPPRDRRNEVAGDWTKVVLVKPRVKGRTSKRPTFVYKTLREAMRQHGRWVRTSIEAKRPTFEGFAKYVSNEKAVES